MTKDSGKHHPHFKNPVMWSWKSLAQVIQAVTWLYKLVGGHQQPLKGSLKHPKKVTKNCQGDWFSMFFFLSLSFRPVFLVFFGLLGSFSGDYVWDVDVFLVEFVRDNMSIMSINICICMCICTMYMYMYMYMHMHMHMYMVMYVRHVYIYIHTYIRATFQDTNFHRYYLQLKIGNLISTFSKRRYINKS